MLDDVIICPPPVEASISGGVEDIERIGRGVGARSGRLGSTYAEGSRIWPMRPFARIRACTPSSQKKKSLFEVRI